MKNIFRGMLILAGVVVLGIFAYAENQATTDGQTAEVKVAYPINFCVVSGEKLGGMGDPVVKVYDGREVQFCCNGCVKTFEKDQAKYMKKLDEAIVEAQKPHYPLGTCVVSGEPLVHSEMGDPVDFVYDNRLVRLCCSGCEAAVKKDPAKYFAKIDAAAATQGTTSSEEPAAPDQGQSHEGHQH